MLVLKKTTSINQVVRCLILAAFSLHSGITYLFQSTPLVAWKQMLVMILISLSLIHTKRIGKNLAFLGLAYGYIVILNAPFALWGDADLEDYLLEITSLSGVFSALLFGGHSDRRLFRATARLMIFFIGAGILFDYKFRYFHFISDVEVDFQQGYRPVFLLGSSTLLYPVLGGLFYITAVNSKNFIFIAFLSIWVIFVAFVSGSRASFILLTMLSAVLMLREQKIKTSAKVIFSLFLLSLLVAGIFMANSGMFGFGVRLLSLLSKSDPGNLTRFALWNEYLSYILPNINWLGSGLGYLKGSENKYSSEHFESSFISLSIETGILGIIIFYFVLPFFLLRLSRGGASKTFVIMYFLHSVFAPSLLSIVGLFFVGAVVNISRTTHRAARF